MEQTDKERRDKIAQILRDGITFSGQVGDYVIHGAIDELIKYNETQVIPLRERLEKVEKALKEARDVLVMASLIDKTSTCMDAVNEIDQLLTKEG